jgi:aspartate aminotransferase
MISSPIRKFEPLIVAAEARGIEVIKLQVGNPDLAAPSEFLSSVHAYADARLPYAPSGGQKDHVAAWMEYWRGFGATLKPEEMIVTLGGTEAIQIAFQTLFDPGDELIVFEPLYSGFKALAPLYGVKLVPVTLDFGTHFALPDDAALERAVSEKTKAILVINPDNPTGKVWTTEELQRVIAFATKHDIAIISDETYREIVFSGEPKTMLTFDEARERLIVVDSLSKRFSLPGARLGAFVTRNAELYAAAMKVAMARLSAPTIEQLATVPLLLHSVTHTEPVRAEYQRRRDALVAAFAAVPSVRVSVPDGAFYVVVKLPVPDAEVFTKFLVSEFNDNGATVMVTPLKDFYLTDGLGRDEIRIALVRDSATLARAAGIIGKAIAAIGVNS